MSAATVLYQDKEQWQATDGKPNDTGPCVSSSQTLQTLTIYLGRIGLSHVTACHAKAVVQQ